MDETVLFEDSARSVSVTCGREPDSSFLELLAKTEWGTSGLRYRLHDVGRMLARLRSAYFLRIRQGRKTVATMVAVRKLISVGEIELDAVYNTLLAVADGYRGEGFAKLLLEEGKRYFFSGMRDPAISYCFVEEGNIRPLRLTESVGYSRLAQFEGTAFGHLWPRARVKADRLEPVELGAFQAELASFYREHTLSDFSHSLLPGEYWVVRRGKEIVAGAQSVPRTISVEHLPGPSGWLLSKVAPHLARLHSLFALTPHNYLRCGNLFYLGEDATPLVRLLETLLHYHGMSHGVVFLDRRSPVFGAIRRAGFGIVHYVSPSPSIHLLVSPRGEVDTIVAQLARGPLVLSPLDQ